MPEIVMTIDIILEPQEMPTMEEAHDMVCKMLKGVEAPWTTRYLAILDDDGDIVKESFSHAW